MRYIVIMWASVISWLHRCVAPCTSVAAPLLIPGPSFPPGTRAPTTMQGHAFLPIPSAPIAFSGAPGFMQSTGAPPQSLQYRLWQERRGPVRPRLMLVYLWPLQLGQCICLSICLGPWHSRPPCKPNLKSLLGNTVRDARVTAAASVAGSSHSRTREQAPLKPRRASSLTPTWAPPSGIKVTNTVTTKTVKPLPASPQDRTSQDVKAMVQDMVKSSQTQLGVIPQETPTRPQAQSSTTDPESPQLADSSGGENSDSDGRALTLGLLNWTS